MIPRSGSEVLEVAMQGRIHKSMVFGASNTSRSRTIKVLRVMIVQCYVIVNDEEVSVYSTLLSM